ncbi:MAG: molecular chaperone DjiA [Pseudomonadota bacterium]
MSIWERLKKSLAAIARGEPLARVFERLERAPEHSVAFTIAMIGLGAKMAKADGRVTHDEITAFREIFHIPAGAERQAARVYNLARTDVAGFESYAHQIARMFAERPAMRADLLEGLVYIAAADGEYHPGEAVFLERVAEIFGVDETAFRAMRARHLPGERDPWQILGVEPGADPDTLRTRYRALVRELHPDQMVARGVPVEARRLAERRLAAVTAAYAELRGAATAETG